MACIERFAMFIMYLSICTNCIVETMPFHMGFEDARKSEGSEIVAPKYMLDLYRVIADEHGSRRKGLRLTADKIRCFLSGSSNRLPKNTMSFDVRDIGFDEEISRAELNLFKLRPKLPKGPTSRRFVPVEVLDAKNGEKAAVRLLSTYGGGWKSFDMTQTVKKWHRRRNELNGISIRVEGKLIGNRSISFGRHESMEHKPFLIVYTRSNKRHMGLRNDKEAQELFAGKSVIPVQKPERRSRNTRGSNAHPCKRKSMIVDTRLIGWDRHILAPRTFDAYRCEGKCRSYASQAVTKQTNHAVLQAILSQLGTKYNGRPVKAPCCAPSQFESKTLLLRRDIKGQAVIGLEEFTDMVVKSCACL